MPLQGGQNWKYNTQNGSDLLLAINAWFKQLRHWRGRGAVLLYELGTYADMLHMHCIQKEAYASLLELIAQSTSNLAGSAPVTPSLMYVAFSCLYEILFSLTSSQFCGRRLKIGP